MKKIEEKPTLFLRNVTLYLDDIVSINEVMQAFDETGKLEIVIGGYELSSLAELGQMPQKEYRDIRIFYGDRLAPWWFSLSVDRMGVFLSYDGISNELTTRGAFSKIEKILLSRHRKWNWFEVFFYLSALIGGLAAPLIVYGLLNENSNQILAGIGIASIVLWIFVVYVTVRPTGKSKIILVEKSKHNTFWKQNQNGIILVVITAAVTVVATLLTQWLGTVLLGK